MGCCSCLSRSPGFIHVRANIARQLQLRGTCVQVNLFVVNRSAKQITPNVTLKQRQEFRAPTKCKVVENELLACNGNVVQPGDSVLQSILLPLSLDLPLVHNCPIISISYRIKIGIEIPRAFDMYFHLPILLTQHPLQSLTLTVARNSSPTNLVDDPLGSANRQSPIIDLHPPLPPSSPSSSLPHPNNPLPFALVPTQSDSVAKPLSKK